MVIVSQKRDSKGISLALIAGSHIVHTVYTQPSGSLLLKYMFVLYKVCKEWGYMLPTTAECVRDEFRLASRKNERNGWWDGGWRMEDWRIHDQKNDGVCMDKEDETSSTKTKTESYEMAFHSSY